MGNDVGRRVLLAALTACFLVLLFLCAQGRVIIRLQAEVANPRQNDSVFIEFRDDDVLYVGGEGKLYATDLHALIEGESLKGDDIRNIIVGDGITEIGYDAINRWQAIETIWLGDGVTFVGNGSIRDCPALRFIRLPAGLVRAGRDFLYDCDGCYVVAAGTEKSLPKLRNVSKKRLLTEVDSCEALAAALGEGVELPPALKHWWL